jgi:hypothetical protein
MHLTCEEKLWPLTAHPVTPALAEEVQDWLILGCHKKCLVRPGLTTGMWRLTEDGYAEWRALRD